MADDVLIAGIFEQQISLPDVSEKVSTHRKPSFTEAVGLVATLFRLNGVKNIVVAETAAALYAHRTHDTALIHLQIANSKEKCLLIAGSLGFVYYGMDGRSVLFKHNEWGYSLIVDLAPYENFYYNKNYTVFRLQRYLIWIQSIEKTVIGKLQQFCDLKDFYDLKIAALICIYNEINLHDILWWSKRNHKEKEYEYLLAILEKIACEINLRR